MKIQFVKNHHLCGIYIYTHIYIYKHKYVTCTPHTHIYFSCQPNKMHNLKVENYVLFGRLAKDLTPGGNLSDCSEGLL